MAFRIMATFLVASALVGAANPMAVANECAKSSVELTWLGVTTFFVKYEYKGRTVKLLLDDRLEKTTVDPILNDVLGAKGKIDYLFIGHNHFDHTGLCHGWVTEYAMRLLIGVHYPYECDPFYNHARDYSMHVVGPKRMCDLVLNGTECTATIPNPDSLLSLDLKDIGLRVTAVPVKHSMNIPRGAPGCTDDLRCPDTHSFLFEFPGQAGKEKACASTVYWQNSINSLGPPYLEGSYSTTPPLDYGKLLNTAFKDRATPKTTLMAIPSNFIFNEASFEEFARVIRPIAHCSIHTGNCAAHLLGCGVGPSKDYPELEEHFTGDADPNANNAWLGKATVPALNGSRAYTPNFLNITDFFDTIRISGPQSAALVDLGYADKFRKKIGILV